MVRYTIIFILIVNPLVAQKNIRTHLVPHEQRANTLFRSFSYEEALIAYKAALFQHPEQDSLKLMVAETYRLLNEPENAVEYYEMVVNDPKVVFPIHLYYYAQALKTLGRYEDALKWYKTYEALIGSDSRVQRNIAGLKIRDQLTRDSLMYTVLNLRGLNSKNSDFSPAFYRDGIAFVSDRIHNQVAIKSVYHWNSSPYLNLFYSKKGQTFSRPERLRTFNTRLHEGPSVFYDHSSKVILTRNTKPTKNQKNDIVTIGLFMAELQENKKWSKAIPMPFNADNYSVGHPAITSDGKTIYFVSNMPGGYGGTDIYISENIEGQWSAPKNMGKIINTKDDEKFLFYHADGTLYFSSTGHGSLGGLDIYKINPESDSAVTNLGYPINSQGDDFGIILTHDTQSGYFSSNRKGGAGKDDLYYFKLREPYLNIVVQDKNSGEKIPLAVVQLTAGSNTVDSIATNDKGEAAIALSQLYDYRIRVSKNGYDGSEMILHKEELRGQDTIAVQVELAHPLAVRETIAAVTSGEISENNTEVHINDSIKYYEVTNPSGRWQHFLTRDKELLVLDKNDFNENLLENTNVSMEVEVTSPGPLRGKNIVNKLRAQGFDTEYIQLRSLYYDFDKSKIRDDARSELDKIIVLMKNHPELRIHLSGHTDSRGSEKYNDALARERAVVAKAYLVSHGIAAGRIITDAFGEQLILNECGDDVKCLEEKHQQNRRTEIKFIFK